MGHYVGLPGVRGRLTPGKKHFQNTVSGLLRNLRGGRGGRITSIAGDHGSLTVWIDDKGDYRGNFCRFGSVLADCHVTTKKALGDFARVWYASTLKPIAPSGEGRS